MRFSTPSGFPAVARLLLALVLFVSLTGVRMTAESLQALQMRYLTPAYKEAALKLLLEEANAIAKELQLPEKLPIVRDDLVEISINAIIWTDSAGSFGGISTRRYHYIAGIGNKISSVVRNFGDSDETMPAYWELLKKKYQARPVNVNTNAAFNLATQWLAGASFDVPALLRDSEVKIYTGTEGGKFLGFYVVGIGNSAEVHLVEPEHALLDLTVSKPQYIKRKKLVVPNRDWLLQQTDDPRMRKMWLTTESYKQAALGAMLKEVNALCRQLNLAQRLPVQSSNLTELRIETPFFSDHKGMFASLSTEDYVFAAGESNKLSYVNKNFRLRDDEAEYRESLKARYKRPRTEVNTNTAYALATQWLAAFSVDVKALERDYRATVSWWDLGDYFVPLYTVEWRKAGTGESAASVELVGPERFLKKLWVEKPEYIGREPLVVPDREKLLSQTNAPAE
jgi:hypothetical protein